MYKPYEWVVLEIKTPKETYYKLLVDMRNIAEPWRVNSGIEKVTTSKGTNEFIIHGNTGSKYWVMNEYYGLSKVTDSVLEKIQQQAEAQSIQLKVLSLKEFAELSIKLS